MRGEAGLFADLAALGIAFDLHEHRAVFTVEESRAIDGDIPGEHTKNLFLKDTGGCFWLLTVPALARVDLKALPQAIGCKRVSFGKAEDLVRLLGVEPGSVTPLATVNAAPSTIRIVIDQHIAKADRTNVHPLRNTATVGLSGPDLMRLLEHWGHEAIVAAIPAKDEE
ncbi:prolyl-tRNA synthetase associated domain-containing protein [Sphingomicrobium flavum]|uniref:prolyl-tRNA synthetase associated domain-containing protein n=1 Tax=Sphingomicrobium flavum TaxID=1229164 RepID=UPI0021ADF584|nr:prolyl-tRNA synthetase associated domain-containing protein [Sphingomicrobium flavum]